MFVLTILPLRIIMFDSPLVRLDLSSLTSCLCLILSVLVISADI